MALVIADMFGIPGVRGDLVSLLTSAARDAAGQEGCLRYTVTADVADPDHYVVVEEWRDQAALRDHYSSPSFERFQFALHGLLARPSEARIHSGSGVLRPLDSGPIDPRDAD